MENKYMSTKEYENYELDVDTVVKRINDDVSNILISSLTPYIRRANESTAQCSAVSKVLQQLPEFKLLLEEKLQLSAEVKLLKKQIADADLNINTSPIKLTVSEISRDSDYNDSLSEDDSLSSETTTNSTYGTTELFSSRPHLPAPGHMNWELEETKTKYQKELNSQQNIFQEEEFAKNKLYNHDISADVDKIAEETEGSEQEEEVEEVEEEESEEYEQEEDDEEKILQEQHNQQDKSEEESEEEEIPEQEQGEEQGEEQEEEQEQSEKEESEEEESQEEELAQEDSEEEIPIPSFPSVPRTAHIDVIKDFENQDEDQDEDEEEEEELFEVDITIPGTTDLKTYYTSDIKNGVIYEIDDDDEPGDEVGCFKNGHATFNM